MAHYSKARHALCFNTKRERGSGRRERLFKSHTAQKYRSRRIVWLQRAIIHFWRREEWS